MGGTLLAQAALAARARDAAQPIEIEDRQRSHAPGAAEMAVQADGAEILVFDLP
jgi:hypothetical protein